MKIHRPPFDRSFGLEGKLGKLLDANRQLKSRPPRKRKEITKKEKKEKTVLPTVGLQPDDVAGSFRPCALCKRANPEKIVLKTKANRSNYCGPSKGATPRLSVKRSQGLSENNNWQW